MDTLQNGTPPQKAAIKVEVDLTNGKWDWQPLTPEVPVALFVNALHCIAANLVNLQIHQKQQELAQQKRVILPSGPLPPHPG
jgi:hypothetical protein